MKLDILRKGEVIKTVKMPDTIGCGIIMAGVGFMYGCAVGLVSDLSTIMKTVVRKH